MDDVHQQLKIVFESLEKDKIKEGFNLFNYFDKKQLYPHIELKQLVKENNKFNYLNNEDFIPSTKFKNFINDHIGKCGLYFLYDESQVLMYIGKSTSLGDRLLASIRERRIRDGFVQVALTENIADMNIYEPYYVSIENPFLNSEFKTHANLSIELKPLEKSILIKILSKEL